MLALKSKAAYGPVQFINELLTNNKRLHLGLELLPYLLEFTTTLQKHLSQRYSWPSAMEMSLDAAFDDVLQSASSEEEKVKLKNLYDKFLGMYTSNLIPE